MFKIPNPFKKGDNEFKLDEYSVPSMKDSNNSSFDPALGTENSQEQPSELNTEANTNFENPFNNNSDDAGNNLLPSTNDIHSNDSSGQESMFNPAQNSPSQNIGTDVNSIHSEVSRVKIDTMEAKVSLMEARMSSIEHKIDTIILMLENEISEDTKKKLRFQSMRESYRK